MGGAIAFRKRRPFCRSNALRRSEQEIPARRDRLERCRDNRGALACYRCRPHHLDESPRNGEGGPRLGARFAEGNFERAARSTRGGRSSQLPPGLERTARLGRRKELG